MRDFCFHLYYNHHQPTVVCVFTEHHPNNSAFRSVSTKTEVKDTAGCVDFLFYTLAGL